MVGIVDVNRVVVVVLDMLIVFVVLVFGLDIWEIKKNMWCVFGD